MKKVELIFLVILYFLSNLAILQAQTTSSEVLKTSPSATQEQLITTVIPTTTVTVESNNLNNSTADISFNLGPNWWIRGYAGYDFSLLGDMVNGTNAYAGYEPGYVSNVSSNTGHSGIRVGLELGRWIDKENAISLSAENIWSQTDSATVVDPIETYTQSVSPQLLSVSVNFYHYFANEKANETYLVIGLGYYHGSVDYLETDSVYAPSTGTVTGDILGGTIGVGKVWSIGDLFSLDVSIKGRYAAFNELTSPSFISNGGFIDNYPPYTLIIYENQNGTLNEGTAQFVGKGSRYAGLDYSGLDGDVSLKFQF